MSDPRRPFSTPPCPSPTMHHCAFISSPPPPPPLHHHQTYLNQPDPLHGQQHFTRQNQDTALEEGDWSPDSQFPASMLSSYTCPQQDLDAHMTSQIQFESGLSYDPFQSDVFHYPEPQYLQSNNFYSHITSQPTDVSPWGPMEPAAPQLQCSSLSYASRDTGQGPWSSPHYDFHLNTDASLQFYPNSYQENQCFLSPSTPGPSPQYPPPSFGTNPGDGNDRLGNGLFLDPGIFTVTSEFNSGQTAVVQEQTKPKKATRSRAVRPRRSRSNKGKSKASLTLSVSLEEGAMLPQSTRRRLREEERMAPIETTAWGQAGHLCVSLMRDRDGSHYRPPPLLNPSRDGPGLHCSLQQTTSGAVSKYTAMLGTLTSETTAPCINVGRSFQAEIPPTKHRRHAHSDPHNALLLWKPSAELGQSANEYRVDALLRLAQSSAVPKGGANPEDALLLLSQNRGDILLTVEKLLNKSPKQQLSFINTDAVNFVKVEENLKTFQKATVMETLNRERLPAHTDLNGSFTKPAPKQS